MSDPIQEVLNHAMYQGACPAGNFGGAIQCEASVGAIRQAIKSWGLLNEEEISVKAGDTAHFGRTLVKIIPGDDVNVRAWWTHGNVELQPL